MPAQAWPPPEYGAPRQRREWESDTWEEVADDEWEHDTDDEWERPAAEGWGQPGPGEWAERDATAVAAPTMPDWGRLTRRDERSYMDATLAYPTDDLPLPTPDLTDALRDRKKRKPPRELGWRLGLYAWSHGRINPGQSTEEAARTELEHRIAAELLEPHRVAVVSIKGGVGKTTVSACLGLVLSQLRGDRVIALDANPHAGTLAERLTGTNTSTARDLAEDLPNIRAVSALKDYVQTVGRLHVLGSEQDATRGDEFDDQAYMGVMQLLSAAYSVIVTDSGTGMVHPVMDATLQAADSLVVVCSLTIDSAVRAARTFEFLIDHGYRELADQAVVVMCADRQSPDVDDARLRSYFANRCRAVTTIPHDPHLETGGKINPAAWSHETRDAWYLLAAHVADRFGAPKPNRIPVAPPA